MRSSSEQDWSRQSRTRDYDDRNGMEIEGVELMVVCKGVPVLMLDRSSVFYENASWMLQSALSSSGRADTLYEYCADNEILAECRRLGLNDDEMSIVRLKEPKYHHVKAVGTTGKRSVMLAVVVALMLEEVHNPELLKELKDYKLDKAFIGLISKGTKRVSNGDFMIKRVREAPPAKAELQKVMEEEGVELKIVCKKVPVLTLTKDSPLQEYASWLIQTATDSSGKADAVYEYCVDREVLAECRRLGLSEQEAVVARLRLERQQHVKAVGTCGKRSVMLALVVALVLQREVEPSSLMKEVQGYDRQLEMPVRALLCGALSLAGRSQDEMEGGGGWGSWSNGGGGKRKWSGGDGWDYGNDWYGSWSTRSGKKKAWSKASPNDEESLDRQLEDYWNDGQDR